MSQAEYTPKCQGTQAQNECPGCFLAKPRVRQTTESRTGCECFPGAEHAVASTTAPTHMKFGPGPASPCGQSQIGPGARATAAACRTRNSGRLKAAAA